MTIENFLGNLFTAQAGGAKRSKRSVSKGPKESPSKLDVNKIKKGRDGHHYKIVDVSKTMMPHHVWKKCGSADKRTGKKQVICSSKKSHASVANKPAEYSGELDEMSQGYGGARKSKKSKRSSRKHM